VTRFVGAGNEVIAVAEFLKVGITECFSYRADRGGSAK